jgi:hypothetical protein
VGGSIGALRAPDEQKNFCTEPVQSTSYIWHIGTRPINLAGHFQSLCGVCGQSFRGSW